MWKRGDINSQGLVKAGSRMPVGSSLRSTLLGWSMKQKAVEVISSVIQGTR